MDINISIDDISPHPNSGENVLNQCFNLISCYPDIKFTLFVPMAYTRLNEKTYDLRDYYSFCKNIRSLSRKNFEFGWHGYFHGIKGVSHNDEFAHLGYRQAELVVSLMFDVAKTTSIENIFSPIFRPPAFRMSKGSFDALVDKGIKVFALNPLMYYDIGPLDQSVKVFNWNALPPKYPLIDGDHLNIVYHASEWSKNLLNSHLAEELKKFIELQSNVNFIHIMEWYGHN